jgi:hypothetical protein
LPAGLISTALPLLPLTVIRSPFGAMVMPSGALSAPPEEMVGAFSPTVLVRVSALAMRETVLVSASST